ncbi:MAG: hypothetical protein JJ959_11570 [Nisaea sp.]|uniref:hypothetical protein n=1 Tax=Nisaea sp. TaxID=2024842 RepID=UPI001B2DD815|nr:hypothetical protein [Nisaea sp.]MBO6561171.1 hypothetical protein [Nisaea sp.]
MLDDQVPVETVGTVNPDLGIDFRDNVLAKIRAGQRKFYPEMADLSWYGSFLTHLQRTNGRKFKDQLAQVLAEHTRWITRDFDIKGAAGDPVLGKMAANMKTSGFVYLQFPDAVLSDLKQSLEASKYKNAVEGVLLSFDEVLSKGTRTGYSTASAAEHGDSNLLDFPAIARIAQNPSVLRVLRDHLGALPMVGGFEITLNQANKTGDVPSGDWHADKGSIAFCKMFIYLNDIDKARGPHGFVMGSHDLAAVEARLRADTSLTERAVVELLNMQRWPQELIHRYFPEEQKYHCGPAGLAILEDTRGFHRGSELTNGYRWMITIQWCLDPVTLAMPDRIDLKDVDPSLVPASELERARFRHIFSRYLVPSHD